DAKKTKPGRAKPHGRSTLPESLERRQVLHDLTEAEKTLLLLWPAACLHRRADGRTTGPGTGALFCLTYRQEELRLPALRPGAGSGRTTRADGGASGSGAAGSRAVRSRSVGARHHCQVRRPYPAVPPG